LLPVSIVDPFDAVKVSDGLTPAHAGRFAALLGMLYDEAQGAEHAIDFLHPRRPPQPPNRRRIVARVAGLAAVALIVAYFVLRGQLSDLDDQIRARLRELRNLDNLAKRAAKQQQVAASLGSWEAGNVIWLDELRDLSLRFPSGRDMVVLRMTMSPAGEGGGSIILNGLVRDPAIVVRMERNIRDQYHEISSKRVQERVREKSYSWHFETAMLAGKRDKSQYVSHLADRDLPVQQTAPPSADGTDVPQESPSQPPPMPANEP